MGGLATYPGRVFITGLCVIATILMLLWTYGARQQVKQSVAVAPASPTQEVQATRRATPAPKPTPNRGRDATLASFSATAARPATATAAAPARQLVVRIPRPLRITARPGGGASVGTMPATTRYFGNPMTAWIIRTTPDGRFGQVQVPWKGSRSRGWIPLAGLPRATTATMVKASLSRREVVVTRGGRVVLRVPAAIGASNSPTPRGHFWVVDSVKVPAGQPQFGSHAFALSTIQPRTPPGWTGGNLMAIHGTNDPGSIGSAASAGCLRVSEPALQRLKALLRPGTPVIIGD